MRKPRILSSRLPIAVGRLLVPVAGFGEREVRFDGAKRVLKR
jgi:hypothetical protein